MPDKRTCLKSVSGAALAALLGLTAPAFAANFDTSGIAENPELAARVPAHIREAGVLIGGSDNAYAPWEYLAGDDGQTPEGIDIDIANAITAKWGLKYESQTAPFDGILPALGSKYDVGISAFSISNERMQVVNFVSYFRSGSLWAVKTGNPSGFDPKNYCGTTLALQSGTWHETEVKKVSDACVADGKKAINILPFGKQTEALTRVAAGGADATISGDSQIALAAKLSEGLLETLPSYGAIGESGLNGIAVPKDNMEFSQLIADTLNELIEEGTYAKVLADWGLEVTVDKAEVNPHVKD
ncbi:ABC transporter substrate-binding protein [Roseibium marinum]|uniref:Polar amino acid transport system substrate-binding protein n=1 Tax=Roseibium marinum TaxID=281252 RepID=A0A2S3UNE2_9HYPH|nr:ABC transporter substrate-binding protein [Roseibium marinum]POF29100.1 polar amino acid transport system substrate-binding protein [Roseibium marinum]